MAENEAPSKLDRLRTFTANLPENWDALSSTERREAAIQATGMAPSYLKLVISKDERLKDTFGIVRRKPRARRARQTRASRRKTTENNAANQPAGSKPTPAVQQATRAIAALELPELIQVSKEVRRAIDRKIDEARAEIAAYRRR